MKKIMLVLVTICVYGCMQCAGISPEWMKMVEEGTEPQPDEIYITTTTVYSEVVFDGKFTVKIISPINYPHPYWGGRPIPFKAYAYGGAPSYRFEWTSDADGVIGRGDEFTADDLSVGKYEITLRVRDSVGALKEESIKIEVIKKNPLEASILHPKDGQILIERTIKPEYLALGGIPPYKIRWALNGQVVEKIENLSLGQHILTLNVIDADDDVGEDEVTVTIDLCNRNHICETAEGESHLNCPTDCLSGRRDGYCDRADDGVCDPDCSRREDVNCLCNRNGICEMEFENHFNCKMDCKSGSPEGYCDSLSDGVCDPDCDGSDPDCGVNYSNYVMVLIAGMFMFGALYYIKLKIGAIE